MADLIDRQVAIDEIEKTIKANKSIHYEMRYWEDGMNCAVDIVEWLPSAQPEQRWIPVSEKLPSPDERVLVFTTGHEYHVWDAMPNRAESYAWEDEEGLYHNLYEVDLWMPLPEPYTE